MMWQVVRLATGGIAKPALIALVLLAGDAVARPSEPAGPGRSVAGLEEPLVATRPTLPVEDRALDLAIAAFRIAVVKTPSDTSSQLMLLARYVERHPGSGWNAAVLVNLGLAYYRAGYFARALDCWQAAWREGRDATAGRARGLVDRALVELARLHVRLGHADELDALFREIGERTFEGRVAEVMTAAREAAWVMRRDPGSAYRCGPNALKLLLMARGAGGESSSFLDRERSGPHGFSLWQLAGFAERAGLRYRLIHREPGQAIPVPSVIHWNMHHFAVIVGARDGGYLIKDQALGAGIEEMWVRASALDTETSGFFLVPDDVAGDPRWREATVAETSQVYGTGSPAHRARARRAALRR